MKIFISYSEYDPIKPEVLSSIKGDIVQINCTFDKKIPKLQRIIQAENKLKETALKEDCDFYVYQQSDIIPVKDDNFEVMQKFLTDNPDFGAVALSRCSLLIKNPISGKDSPIVYNKEWNNHICSGCIMFTKDGLKAVKFDLDNGTKQTCYSIGKSLAEANLKYGYVDREIRIKG